MEWHRSGLDEVALDKKTKKIVVAIDSKYFRPAEVETLLGDATKAKENLGWEPKIGFKELVDEMCRYESNNE